MAGYQLARILHPGLPFEQRFRKITDLANDGENPGAMIVVDDLPGTLFDRPKAETV